MRLSLRIFQFLDCRVLSFRTHVHSSPCVICDAAVNEFKDASSALSKNDSAQVTQSTSSHVMNRCSLEEPNRGWRTVLHRRREAFQKWLQNGDEWENMQPKGDTSYLEKCWEAFCDPTRILTNSDIEGTINFLDQFCKVKLNDTVGGQKNAPLGHQKQLQNSADDDDNNKEEGSDNVFLTHLRSRITVPIDIERQLRFQRTLIDFRNVANALQLPFFLCCGTALGVYREGYFIPHDDDIDVGVFFEDLEAISSATGEDVQSAVVSVLSHVALDGHFVLLDICGEVAKGLELRFLHHDTRVSLDLNVYYPPLSEDVDLITQFGPFVWTATHYEDSATRRHGMYRYRHVPFRSLLTRVSFCDPAASSQADGFLVPPLQYLVEYFGPDWQVPKKYTYTEGLRGGEYKNIIEE